MKWNSYSGALLAAVIVLSSIGVAAAADAKFTWPPCGTKVEQADIDAVYVLKPVIKAQFAFYDYNKPNGAQGKFDDSDTAYIDVNGDGVITAGVDIRLTPWHNVPEGDDDFKYPANTKVFNDLDQNLPLVVPGNQAVVKYIDINGNGVYDIEDPVYLDTDYNGVVSTHDVRLTTNTWGYAPYTTVENTDNDRFNVLKLIDTGMFKDLLGFIDSDCSCSWTCPDKMYLQQIKNESIDQNANDYVTIGDLRIYIPPEAITDEGWPSCGTKVEQGDIDAVYTLSNILGVRIGYFDYNHDGAFNDADSAYVDIVNKPNAPDRVDPGDVRITAHHNVLPGSSEYKFPPNTKVGNDEDQNLPLTYPGWQGQLWLIKYFDLNGMYGFDIGDPVYVDMDYSWDVSLYDIRLTGEDAYTTVAPGDSDLGDWLWTIGTGTPEQLIGYIDSDCNGEWSCPDKLYLEQPESTCYYAFEQARDTEIVPPTIMPEPCSYVDRFVTIGDTRLYIPQAAIDNEGWPECGTKVKQGDIDAVYRLKTAKIDPVLRFYDYNGDGIFNGEDTMYLDMDNSKSISWGDIRLTAWHNVPEGDPDRKYEPNTKVFNDLDLNKPLLDLPDAVVAYFDINGMYGFDLADPIYIDTNGDSKVSLYDVRLTATVGKAAYTTVAPGDLDLIETRVLNAIDTIDNLVGYIDSDCSNSWTCPDKLYLNQEFDDIVTIGDLRLYIPPEEIAPTPTPPPSTPCDTYDANNDGVIQRSEAINAINDYFDDKINRAAAIDVINCYFG